MWRKTASSVSLQPFSTPAGRPEARTFLGGRGATIPAAAVPPKALRVVDVPFSVCRSVIAEQHYLGCAPPGGRLFLGILGGGRMVGALMLGRPVARREDQEATLELTRMVLLAGCGRNSESRVLGVLPRLIRARFPEVRRLIAYADPARGHTGTIYAAAGWRRVGATRAGSWARSRRGRRAGPPSSKVKWDLCWAAGP